MENNENASRLPLPGSDTTDARGAGAGSAHPVSGTRQAGDRDLLPAPERILDLVALLVLIALAAVVFTVAGQAAFTAVIGAGVGLFATWRSSRPRG
ncbi:hypothetical protein ACFYRC_28580 [Streptomyces sp. NPDC005279]|uniref:hypothetical protein n=1 Tax=Streptomyces sp. NPDC005279 TaxID=3364712 RepID=UPI0036972C4D